METFWERIIDIMTTVLKAFVVLLVIRVGCLLMNIPFPLPFVDNWIFGFMESVTGWTPRTRI